MLFCSKTDKSENSKTGAGRMNPNKLIMTKTQSLNHRFKMLLGGLFGERGPNRATIQKVLCIIYGICLLSCVFSASASTFDVLDEGQK